MNQITRVTTCDTRYRAVGGAYLNARTRTLLALLNQ